jgi:uncharacterized membrane protein
MMGGELAMKSPVCEIENPEGKKLCVDCGATLSDSPPPAPVRATQPEHVQPKQSWVGSNRRTLVAILVLIVIVVAALGMIFVGPMSRIQVVAHNADKEYPITFTLLIDGREQTTRTLNSEQNFTGTWFVAQGSHLVFVSYQLPDVVFDYQWSIVVRVGPLSSVNVEAPLALGFNHHGAPMTLGAILTIS